jgi:acarbose 7IV-phosphotransferase
MLATGFLASYLFEGYSLEDSVMRGQTAARHACTLRATSDGLITREQLDGEFTARRSPNSSSK